MIIAVFALLLAIGFVLVAFGLKNHDSYFEYAGYTIVFILGFVLLGGSVEYVGGETVSTNHSYTLGNLTSTDSVSVNTYASYSDAWTHVLGVIVSLVAGLAFILRLVQDRRDKEASW